MRFIPTLAQPEVLRHLEQTHSIWGGELSLADRKMRQLDRIAKAGPELMELSGLTNGAGELVSSMKRYYFEMQMGAERGRCVGLGAIFTNLDQRKQGAAGELIRSVLADARARNGCRYALLFSDIGAAYYRRFGFLETPATHLIFPRDRLPKRKPLATREAGAGDMPRLLRWYEEQTERFPVRCLRTRSTWPFFRQLNGIDHNLILSDGKSDVALLSYELVQKKGYLWLEEWLGPPEHEEAVWATLRELATEAKVQEIRCWRLPTYSKLPATDPLPRERQLPMVADLTGASLSPGLMADAYLAGPDHF